MHNEKEIGQGVSTGNKYEEWEFIWNPLEDRSKQPRSKVAARRREGF